MKNPKFFLTTLFAAAAMTATTHAAGEVLLINFASRSGGTGDASWGTWNEIANVNSGGAVSGSDITLVDASGNETDAKLSYWAKNTWQNNNASGILYSYLDDGGDGVSISVSTSFLVADVSIIYSTDSGERQYLPAQVNGTWYTYSNGATVEGSGSWGQTAGTTIEEGVNVLTVSGISGDISVHTTQNGEWWGPRGCIAALKVVDAYAGESFSGTISGDTTWDGISFMPTWQNSQSTVSSSGLMSTTGGSYANLTLTADATLTLNQAVITDAVYLSGTGRLVLEKGTGSLTFTGPAMMSLDSNVVLVVSSEDLALAENVNALSIAGTGTIYFTDDNGLDFLNSKVSGGNSTIFVFEKNLDFGTDSYTVAKGIQFFKGGITAGSISISSGASLGVAAGTSLSIGNNDASTVKSLNLGSGGLYVDGELTVDVTSDATMSGKLAGTGTITVNNTAANGAGMFLTSNGNDFTGKLVVGENAKVQVGPNSDGGSNARLSEDGPDVADIEVMSGGTFVTNLGGSEKTFAGNIVLHNGATIRNNDGHVKLTGNIQFGDDASSVVSYTHWWNKNIELAGVLSGAGTAILEGSTAYWSGETTITISGNSNTFSGTYELKDVVGDWGWSNNPITLKLASENAAKDASINLTGGSETSLKLAADAVTIAGLSGTSGSVISVTGSACTFTVNGGGDFAGNIAPGGEALKLVKGGEGTLALTGTGNNYSGGTEVTGGTLVAAHGGALGSGSVTIAGGTLAFGSGMTSFDRDIIMTSGSLNVESADSFSVSSLTAGSGSILTLGMLSTDTAALTTDGVLSLDKGTIFDLSPALGGTQKITYVLVEGAALDGLTESDVAAMTRDNLLFGGLAATERVGAKFVLDGNVLKLDLVKPIFTDLTWIGGDGATWKYQGDTLWDSQIATETGSTPKFENGDTTIFNAATSVAVEGAVQPGGMNVNADVTFTGLANSDASLALAAGTVLSVADGKTATIDASLATTGLLKKFGAGTVALTGTASSIFSSMQIEEGRVDIASAESLKALFSADITTGATLSVEIGEGATMNTLPAITGEGTVEKRGTGTLALNSDAAFAGTLAVTEGALNVSGGTVSLGALSISGGTATFSGGALSATNGTIVENAELVLATGGASSALRGSLTINDGGLVRLTATDATGWGGGSGAITALTVNEGGELRIETNATPGNGRNQTFVGSITLQGGKITGTAGVSGEYSKIDLYDANKGITTLASDTTAVISATIGLRKNGTIDVARGTTESGVDLEISGWLTNYGQITAQQPDAQTSLTKKGEGTLKLSGDNRYWIKGGAVSEGKLIAASATALGTGAIEVELGGTLEFTTSSGTFTNALSGGGNILVNSAGTITLSGESSFDGTVAIKSGTVLAGSGSAFGTGAVTLSSGTTLERASEATLTLGSLTTEGDVTLVAGALNAGTPAFTVTEATLGDGVKFELGVALTRGTFVLISGNTLNINLAELGTDDLLFGGSGSFRAEAEFTLEDNQLSISFERATYTDLTWQDSAAGEWKANGPTLWKSEEAGGTITFENGDSVIFGTADASVTIAGNVVPGNITVTENTAFSGKDAAGIKLSTGKTFSVAEGKTASADNTVATSGIIEKTGAGKLIFAADAKSVVSSVVITEGTFGFSVTDDSATENTESATYSGEISGSGIFEKAGTGTLVLNAGNTYSGGTLISGGTLSISNKNALGSGLITIGTGAVLDLAVNIDGTRNKYVLDGGTLFASVETTSGQAQIAAGSETIRLTADSFIGGTANFGMISNGYDYNRLELGGNTLTKTGTKYFFLCNTTVNSGKINIEGGAIYFVRDVMIEGNVDFTVSENEGAVLDFNKQGLTLKEGSTVSVSGKIGLPGTITVPAGAYLDLTEAVRLADGSGEGSLNISGGSVKIGNFGWGAGTNFGANYNSDRISLSANGVLELTKAQEDSAVNRGFRVTSGTGTFRYSGTGTNVMAENGDAYRINIASASMLRIDVEKDGATLDVSKVITGSGTLEKIGAGTLVLSGANAHGGTILTEGTLKIGNASALSGGLKLAGGVLAGADEFTDTLTSNVLVSNVATVQNLNFADGAWSFAGTLGVGFAGVALDGVTFANTSVDLSEIEFTEENATMTLFTNYAGTDAGVFTVVGGTIEIDTSKNVVFTAGSSYFTQVWDPEATGAENDKLWTVTLFNGADYSENSNFRKFKFLEKTDGSTELGTIQGQVSAKELDFFGDYAFAGIADAEGTAAKLTFGVSADDAGVVTGVASVAVAEGKTVTFDKTVATAGALEKTGAGKLLLAADASSSVSSVVITEGTFGFSVPDDATTEATESVVYSGSISGNGIFEKTGAGVLSFSGNNENFYGDLLISEGTVKLTGRTSLGARSIGITVGRGGTLDLNGVVDSDYGNFVLAGGSLVNTGNAMGNDYKQITGGISLTDDSYIGGSAEFGMISSGWGSNVLDLAGKLLTKTGENVFFICNTAITSGSVDISGGSIRLTNRSVYVNGEVVLSTSGDGFLDLNNQALSISEGKSLSINGSFSKPGAITINKDATLDLTSASRMEDSAGSGSLTINGGLVRIEKMNWGQGSNFGANFNSDRIKIQNGGVLEVTKTQGATAGGSAGFTAASGIGTYRYSGTGTSYVSESESGQRITLNSGATLVWDVTEADASLEVSKVITGAGAIGLDSTGVVMLSGVNTYTGGTTVTRGTLKIGGGSALGTGTVTIDARGVLETGVLETTSLANVIVGNGNFNVKGDTTLSGNNTFAGTYSVTNDSVLTLTAGSLGNGEETVNVAGGSELNYAPTAGLNAGGKIVLEENAVLRNRGEENSSTTLTSTVTGTGSIIASAGELSLKFAQLGGFKGKLLLESGTLSDVTLDGSAGFSDIALAGGTVKNWVVDNAGDTLRVITTESVAFAGNIELTNGTLVIESLSDTAYFTGTASVNIGDNFIFDFKNLALQDTDDPNTKTAYVQVFDTTGLTLNGWESLSFEDIRIGGRKLDAHYDIDIGTSGDVSITLTSQTLTWTAGETGTWDNASLNWKLDGGTGSDIAFADYDTVCFTGNAEVSLSGELLPAEIVVGDNVALTLKGTGKILGGVTTLGDGASLELAAEAGAVSVFKSKVSGNGMFVLDAATDVSVSATLNGAYTLSGNVAFTKEGAGTLKADVGQLDDFSGAVSIADGKVLVSATDALGTGTVTLDGGSLEIAATKSNPVTVNNVIAGTAANDAPLTISGTGDVILMQANFYAGTTSVSGNAVARNVKAFGTSTVTISGNTVLDVEGEFENDFAGTGSLTVAESVTLSGSLDDLTGTLKTAEGVTLKLDTTGNFSGTASIASGAEFEKVGTGKFTLSGAIDGSSESVIRVSSGTLAVGGSQDQRFAGTLTVDAAFEKLGTNTLTLSGNLAGVGSVSVTDGTLAVGNSTVDQSFAGTVSVASGKTFEKIGTNTLTLSGQLSGSGATTVSAGILELNTANDYALDSVISGAGTLKKSGTGALTLAAGTDVASVDLAAGTLAGLKVGTDGVAMLTVSATETTLEGLTMDGGQLDVSQGAVTLSGATVLSGGTIFLGDADTAAFTVAGTTTISAANSLTFNLKEVNPPPVTNPNTTGETAVTVYGVFTLNAGAVLEGWDASVLDKTNFTVGNGASLSDRATLDFNADGSLTVSNTVYNLVWVGGDGVWDIGEAGAACWAHAANPDDTAYMNSDRVTFTGDAVVTLGANVAPSSLTISDDTDLTVGASDAYGITGSGSVSVGENASLTLNSGHDYTGTTTLANGASLRLNLTANDTTQFASSLALAEGASGSFLVDTGKLGAAGTSDLDGVFTGAVGDGVWTFEKLGAGSLTVASKMSTFTAEDHVNVAAGTLKLLAVDAIGSARTTIADGATLEIASATDAKFSLAFSGNGNFRKSGGGTITLDTANTMFGGDAVVAEGVLKIENDTALGDSRKSTSLEILRNAEAELAFGGSFGKEFKGEGTVRYTLQDRLVLTADSGEFTGTFAVTADNAFVTARQATSFGNGTIALEGQNGELAFDLTPSSGQSVADVFAGSFAGTGAISVCTGLGVAMTLTGSSPDFEGTIALKDDSMLIAGKGDAFGSAKTVLTLGKNSELQIGSAVNSSLDARLSGDGELVKIGTGRLTLANTENDFAGTVTVKDGTLRAASQSALGKSTQVLLDSADATLELVTASGKTATLNKLIRGSGNLSLLGGGTLNWANSEKRFSGLLNISERTVLNTTEFFKLESGEVSLDGDAIWNANGGLSVGGTSRVSLFALKNASAVSEMQARASQTLSTGAQLHVGSFAAATNKTGTVVLEDVTIVPTDGGKGALITFDVESVADAGKVRIALTGDADVTLDNVAVEVTLDESVRNVWDVPEIEFVGIDGKAVDVSGDVSDVTVVMADGTEVKYVYDSRTGNLSLSPISSDMNLAYAAMVTMPTEAFNQDVQSLHRRMEQRRFEIGNNKDEWQFFAQAQAMSVETGSDRSDSATFDFSTYGALVGGDVRLSQSTVFGMALAYDRGTADIHDNQGEITMDSYRATIYAGTVFNDYYFAEGGAHFGFSSYEIERKGDYGDNEGDTDGWSAGLFATAGGLLPTAVEDLFLTPYVGFSYLHTSVDKIEETGTRSMTTDSFEADSLRARIGIGSSYSFDFGETPTRFGLDVAYSHEFLDDEVDADVGATGIAYSRTITEKALPEDSISVGASLDFTLSENTGLFLSYTADFGMNSDVSHRGNVGFRFTY